MPTRKTPLVIDHVYHIFSRGVNRTPIFYQKKDYQRFLDLIKYCHFADYPIKFSKLKSLSNKERGKIKSRLKENFVEFIAYSLMPNHFHFVLKQKIENGISQFINRLLNSYTKFFNTKYKRSGPLFEGRFKAVLIESDSQFHHVVRYVHLNPYSSLVVKTLNELLVYPWSSFPEYLSKSEVLEICEEKQLILSEFANVKSFKEFTLNQADYQRRLEEIKHLLLE
jgi:putative transposase